uniref:receptor-like protein 9DC3 n=1 Tax=Erigeron canadensis TaxID=72917 RepID=UPI001CB9436E|nr:receptor-like protein 9DC3 [Erigeron canadensis]
MVVKASFVASPRYERCEHSRSDRLVSDVNLSSNDFSKTSLNHLLGGFLDCELQIGRPSPLVELDVVDCNISGSAHHVLCSHRVKKYPILLRNAINLGNNHLSGVIPDCWDKWQGMYYLNLENNYFSGAIPGTLGSLRELQSLNMRGNKLSGKIPASLMNLKYLITLQISRNELVGKIPKWFGNLSYLRILNLRSNNFVGNIPYELCYSTHIQILDLADNNLSGSIPRCINNFSVLSSKKVLSDNQISLNAFKAFNGSNSLVMKGRDDTYNSILGLVILLDLSSNNLVGNIPSEISLNIIHHIL